MLCEGLAKVERARSEPESYGSASWSRPPYSASAVRRVFYSCMLRAAEAAGAPCAVPPAAAVPAKMRRPRHSTFLAAFSSRGPVRGRTRRTGGSTRTAPLEPWFRSASIPAMCRPGEPRRLECRRFQPCISECRRIPANPAPKSPGSSFAFLGPYGACFRFSALPPQ